MRVKGPVPSTSMRALFKSSAPGTTPRKSEAATETTTDSKSVRPPADGGESCLQDEEEPEMVEFVRVSHTILFAFILCYQVLALHGP